MKTMSGIAAAALTAALIAPAAAQTYPDRPIRVILPVPAGGTPDVVARLVTPGMAEDLGHQLVVDNRAGAGGLIAAELAAHAVPDGYTLFLTSPGSLTILPHVTKNVPYDADRDFAPIGLISTGPFLLLTHPSVPAKSVRELIALAKAEPGKLNYSSSGNGTANHFAMERFKYAAGINLTHIPYKGAPQAVVDIIAGRINVTFNSIPPVLQHIKSGRLNALGIAGMRRAPQLPEVPTLNEAGVSKFEAGSWLGLLAPARTPKPIIARLNRAMVKALSNADTRSKIEGQGSEAVGNSPEAFGAMLRQESQENARIVKLAGVKVD